jgi:hypothetical protein
VIAPPPPLSVDGKNCLGLDFDTAFGMIVDAPEQATPTPRPTARPQPPQTHTPSAAGPFRCTPGLYISPLALHFPLLLYHCLPLVSSFGCFGRALQAD